MTKRKRSTTQRRGRLRGRFIQSIAWYARSNPLFLLEVRRVNPAIADEALGFPDLSQYSVPAPLSIRDVRKVLSYIREGGDLDQLFEIPETESSVLPNTAAP